MTDVTPGTQDPVKQIIVLRTDLGMPYGKGASQAAHASIRWLTERLVSMEALIDGKFLEMRAALTEAELLWVNGMFTKIVCRLSSVDEMLDLHYTARKAGLESHYIIDSGATVFDGVPTFTALAIGPDFNSKLAPVTGHLELF
jgi:peptidyl-tRNA hydrolase, PTH2 family